MSAADRHCTRCHESPCRCAYKLMPIQPVTLSDFDVERIARRVVELMREEKK